MPILCKTKKNKIMTHYHLYIIAGATIDSGTVFYRVRIGTGRQADRDFLYLLATATSCGYYFEKWSDDVDDFLQKIRRSFERDGIQFQLREIKARQLVRALKANIQLPISSDFLKNSYHMRNLLDGNYLLSCRMAYPAKGKTKKT